MKFEFLIKFIDIFFSYNSSYEIYIEQIIYDEQFLDLYLL